MIIVMILWINFNCIASLLSFCVVIAHRTSNMNTVPLTLKTTDAELLVGKKKNLSDDEQYIKDNKLVSIDLTYWTVHSMTSVWTLK